MPLRRRTALASDEEPPQAACEARILAAQALFDRFEDSTLVLVDHAHPPRREARLRAAQLLVPPSGRTNLALALRSVRAGSGRWPRSAAGRPLAVLRTTAARRISVVTPPLHGAPVAFLDPGGATSKANRGVVLRFGRLLPEVRDPGLG